MLQGSSSTLHSAAAIGRAETGKTQMHPIQPAAGAQIERLALLVAPGPVGHVLGRNDRPEMPTSWRYDPEPARARDVKVALLVHFDPVNSVVALRTGHV